MICGTVVFVVDAALIARLAGILAAFEDAVEILQFVRGVVGFDFVVFAVVG